MFQYVIPKQLIKKKENKINEVIRPMTKINKDLKISDVDKVLQDLIKIDFLWEKSSAIATFASQTINLDLSKYNFVIIESFRYPKITNYRIITIVAKYTASQIVYSDYEINQARAWNRDVTVSPSGISFGNATINGATDNNALVPARIFGIC